VGSSPRGYAFAFARDFALRKIDGFSATTAIMGTVEFVRKDFFFLTAFGTTACKRFEIFEICITRTMLGC
jgi:hypothetical protein